MRRNEKQEKEQWGPFSNSGAGGAEVEERSCGNGLDLAEVKGILMSVPAIDTISSPAQLSQWVNSTYPSGTTCKSTTKASWKSLKMVCPTHSFKKQTNKKRLCSTTCICCGALDKLSTLSLSFFISKKESNNIYLLLWRRKDIMHEKC